MWYIYSNNFVAHEKNYGKQKSTIQIIYLHIIISFIKNIVENQIVGK